MKFIWSSHENLISMTAIMISSLWQMLQLMYCFKNNRNNLSFMLRSISCIGDIISWYIDHYIKVTIPFILM